MPMNTIPVFTHTPNIGWANLLAADANTALDGTGTVKTVFTAGNQGGYAQSLMVKASTTVATSTTATLRIWINNGSTNGTATNNTLFREYPLGAVTGSSTVPTFNYEFPLNVMLPAGYKIILTVATMAANTGWQFTCVGADY